MKTALLLVVAIILAANSASSTALDSCLKMALPNDYSQWYDSTTQTLQYSGSANPDSVMIDTCSGSATFNRLFAKRWFTLQFLPNFYPFNSGLDSGEIKGVSEIDSSHAIFKNRLIGLQDTFGLIFFQGIEYNTTDSVLLLNPLIRVFFENYQDVESITEHFSNTIDSIKTCIYSNRAKTPHTGIQEEQTVRDWFVYPNPVKDYLMVTLTNSRINKGKIEVFSIDGKKVIDSEYKERIDVSMLTKGSYILKIHSHTIKFIKE